MAPLSSSGRVTAPCAAHGLIFCSEFCRVVLDSAFIQIRQFTRPRHLRRFRPFAELAQVQEPGRSGGEEGGKGGVAVNRPMMIDATAKRKAATKVKAINFSIDFPGPEAF